MMIKKICIQNVNIDNINSEQFFSLLRGYLRENKKRTIGFVNAHCINIARANEEYRRIINNFDLVLPDGVGIFIASALKKNPVYESLNGTDLMPKVFENLAPEGVSFFLLGAKPGVATKAEMNLKKEHPHIKIVGCMHGYFSKEQEKSIQEKINRCNPDVLLVATGVPKQEEWIERNKDRIDAKIFIGVGGLFDFVTGVRKRLPVWMRKIGIEWAYRLYQEPKRLWRRYIFGNFKFLYHAFEEAVKEKALKK